MRGQTTFEKLIAPLKPAEFFSTYWGKTYLHISRNDPTYHHDVLRFDDVDEYLARNDLRYPYIRLVKEGRELPLNNYSFDSPFGENLFQGNLDQDALFAEYANGATMCMQLQHQAMPTLGRFTSLIESYFGFRTQSTIFLTPANSHGFTRHFDSHDFFTLPISGTKTWRIYAERTDYPLPRREVLDSSVETTGTIEREIELKPGDTLYVPRGVFHDARGEGEASMQISLGVFPYYWCDILHQLIDDVADRDPSLRKAAVSNVDLNAPALEAAFQRILDTLKRDTRITDTIASLQKRARSKQLKEGTRRLSDLNTLDTVTPDTQFSCRDVDVRASVEGETLTIAFYNKSLELPSVAEEQVRFILTGQPFSANTLPDSLDLAGRLFLIRQLVVEGLITQSPHARA